MQLLLIRQPGILTLDARTVSGKLQHLQQALGQPRGTVEAMVSANPALLTVSSLLVQQKWRRLRSVAQTHPDWQRQLRSMSPKSLATYLCLGEHRIQRLEFLAQHGVQATCSLAQCLKAPDGLFSHRFEGYDLWRERKTTGSSSLSRAPAEG